MKRVVIGLLFSSMMLNVAQAQEEATALAKQADATIAAQRRTLDEETERRIAGFRKSAVEGHEQDLAEADAAHRGALDSIDQIPEGRMQEQVQRIVTAFKGL